MHFIKQFIASTHWIAGASMILAGCATVAPTQYPEDHPANPAAPAALAAPSLSALATYKPFDSAAKPDASPDTGLGEAPKTDQPGQEGGHEHRH